MKYNDRFKKTILYFTIIVYIYLLLSIIVFKDFLFSPMELFNQNRELIRSINIIPFKNLWDINMSNKFNIISIVGNTILFIPLGVYISIIFNNFKEKKQVIVKNILIIAIISLIFEVTQYTLGIGITDINDIILNTIGGIIGIVIHNILIYIMDKQSVEKLIINIGGILAILIFILQLVTIIANFS